jgi:hypothetical protein
VKFQHIEGQKNIMTDTLSRSTQEEERSGKIVDVLHGSILSITSQPQCNMVIIGEKIQFDYEKDTEFEKTYKMFKEQNTLVQGNVRVSRLIYISKQDRKMVLKTYHNEKEHTGGNKVTRWESYSTRTT